MQIVDSVEDAISHINVNGSHHTDVIVTEDDVAARKFSKVCPCAIDGK